MFRKEKGNIPSCCLHGVGFFLFLTSPLLFTHCPAPVPTLPLGHHSSEIRIHKSPSVSSEERKQTREPTLGRSQRAELLPQWLRCPGAEHRGVVRELSLRPGLRGCWKLGQCRSPGLLQIRSCPRREPPVSLAGTQTHDQPQPHFPFSSPGGWASWRPVDTCPAHGQVSFLPKDRRLRASPGTPTDRIHPKG